MKKYLLLALIFVLFLFGPSLAYSTIEKTTHKATEPPKSLNSEILWSLIQTWRQSDDCRPGGCQAYIRDQRLCEVAEDRVNDDLDYHEGLYEKYSDYPFVIQENSNKGYLTESSALYGWLSSKPHAETLRKPYTHSCVATKDNFSVQIFSNME